MNKRKRMKGKTQYDTQKLPAHPEIQRKNEKGRKGRKRRRKAEEKKKAMQLTEKEKNDGIING